MNTNNGWLDIASAPKDGTEILVFHPEGGVCAAFCPGEGFAWHCMDGMNTVIGKKSRQSIPAMTSFTEPPTHWMPLPPAPTSHPIPTGATGDAQMAAELMPKLQSLLDRMANDPRIGAMFEADGDTLRDAMHLCRSVKVCASISAPAAGDALDALRELVACDNIKKQIASMQVCVLETDDDVQELDGLMSDLARRQPAAWDAARAAIAQQKGEA